MRNAYDLAQKILCDKYIVDSVVKNRKNGPLILGNIKGKCVASMGELHKEIIQLPRFTMKYKYLFVVYQKNGQERKRTNTTLDDVYVYRTEDIKNSTNRSYGTVPFKSMPIALDMDIVQKKVKLALNE